MVIEELVEGGVCVQDTLYKILKKSIKLLFSKDTERGGNQLKLFS